MKALNEQAASFVYHAWLAAASVQPDRLREILELYETPEGVFRAFQARDEGIMNGLSDAQRRILREGSAAETLREYERLMKLHHIGAMTFDDTGYPERLSWISDPPAILFYQGNPGCLSSRTVAVVGSRASSYDGRKAAEKIARELSDAGVCIVSGLADGIDAAAHRGCLKGRTPTAAVTGCGLDRVYPSGNQSLRDEVLNRDGVLLSEYTPGEKPLGWHFPVRNRILTGIAEALILMEARIRSGSMTSVQHALDQGKEVFVYPGDPTSPYSEGNRQLLREGANYFTTSRDILEDLGWLDNTPIIGQNSVCSREQTASSPEEALVLKALQPGALGFERLAGITGLTPSALMSTLTMLQIRGAVEALPGKQYRMAGKR